MSRAAAARAPVVGPGTCRSCSAPILWVQTAAGKTMPLDPPVLRASRQGPGRLVSLLDGAGAMRVRLHEDPAGDIAGREPHWGSCTAPERHRKTRAADPHAERRDRGARFLCRRVALDLVGTAGAVELLGDLYPRRAAATWLHRFESGESVPQEGWAVLEARLERALRSRVAALVAEGWRWQDIRFAGWSAAEIRDAARAAGRQG